MTATRTTTPTKATEALAVALAKAMNARPLPEGCDGGDWYATTAGHDDCEKCERVMEYPELCVACGIGGGLMFVCLPCAEKECAK